MKIDHPIIQEIIKKAKAEKDSAKLKELNEDFKFYTGRDILVGDLYGELTLSGNMRNFFMENLRKV